MKTFTIVSLLGLAASVSAQYTNQTGPFYLKLESKNETINGLYLFSCHAGAAIEGLCYGSDGPSTLGEYNAFYFNYSGTQQFGDSEIGTITWNEPANVDGSVVNVSEAVQFSYPSTSNVAVPLFFPGEDTNVALGFDDKKELFLVSYYDDSTIVAGQYPNSTGKAYYKWVTCYQQVGGYFYYAVGWVTGGAPTNPTCEDVRIIQQAI